MALIVRRLDAGAELPSYAHAGDAGLDLAARESVTLGSRGGRAAVRTGLSMAIEAGYVGLVLPRSGLALHNGVTVLNAPGVIDSSFRGEVVVVLVNLDAVNDYAVRVGDRIAQLVIMPAAFQQVIEVAELPDSERGSLGLGETGR